MSGIFGVIDTRGIDAAQVERAAEAMRYRGQLSMVTEGSIALGVCGDVQGRFLKDPHRLGVVDGRVDARTVAGDPDREPPPGVEFLLELVARRGPGALDDVAADFALAVVDRRSGELLLARDAFGLRPLFWASDHGRTGFASDPSFLVRLGLSSGGPDVEAYRTRVEQHRVAGSRTGFDRIYRVPGGRWIRLAGDRSIAGRWFRPEDVAPTDRPLGLVVEDLRSRVRAALESRSRGGATALLLSGGRDSASLAIAAASAGLAPHCYTYRLEGVPDDEVDLARQVAGWCGLGWEVIDVPSQQSEQELMHMVGETGTPFSPPAFPITMEIASSLRGEEPLTVLDGEGGDLFGASPLALRDIVRSGRPVLAMRAMRGWARGPGWPATTQVKMVGRSLAPSWFLRTYDGFRGRPGMVLTVDRSRTAREELVAELIAAGEEGPDEATERVFARARLTPTSPFLDLRVIRLVQEVPTALRLPVHDFKPLLREAFLGSDLGTTRVKADHRGYYARLARSLSQDFPGLVTGAPEIEGLLGKHLALREMGLLDSLHVVGPEAWLRWGRPAGEPGDRSV